MQICAKIFSVANLGVKTLESHGNGDRHVPPSSQKTLNSMIQNAEKPSENTPSNLQQAFISTSCNASLARNAEIMWAVDVILSSYSYRSSAKKSNLFCGMFLDSEAAQNVSCGKTKCGYLICFVIAPYFKEQLEKISHETPYFVALFDESYNAVSKNGQMDLHVRFWDSSENLVKTRH